MDNQIDTSNNEEIKQTIIANPEVNYFGLANYRNQNRKFGIKLDDRRRHMYVVGKTGMGKTTLLENMVLNDIYAGHGLGYVDPHGDTAEKILNYIPANRINDVVYFNPADLDYPIGFNILETIRPEQKHLVASGLMGVFKKIWPDVWSSRMEYILNNTILALLDFPGTTLLGINRLLADAEYRRRVVNNTKDPVIKAFWQTEFAAYNDKYKQEAVAPIQNKIGQFLSASVIRNIVAQVKSRINIREIMDEKKIFIMNLSKGRIGEDNSRLLGGMLITKIQLSAMERVDTPETKRPDFFLYVDEFQNFATESFANILSEARKYRLDLIMAHQYMEQLEEEVLAAVIGNVGSIITFRVGSTDAEILAKEFIPTFVEEDLINLPKFHIYLKLMIDGVASKPFSALTLSPIAIATGSMEKVVKVSRERYAQSRDKIEDKIARWSGMVIIPGDEASELEVDEDEAMFVDTPKKNVESEPVVEKIPAPSVVQVTPVQAPVEKQEEIKVIQPAQLTTPIIKTETILAPFPKKVDPVIKNPFSHTTQPVVVQSTNTVQTLSKSAKKRRRKKNNKGNQNFTAGNQVVLGDPSQKGISLSVLQPVKTPNVPVSSPNVPVRSPAESTVVPIKEAPLPSTDKQIDISKPKIMQPGQVNKID